MVLTKHRIGSVGRSSVFGAGQVFHYRISGLPPGEHAMIAQFPDRAWRFLRWNAEWHGNWTGRYDSADAALEALREEVLTAVA